MARYWILDGSLLMSILLVVALSILHMLRGSRNFRQRGPGQPYKKSSDNVFFFFFFCPQLNLQKSNGQFQRNLSFFKVPEGVQHFPGGPTFSRGGGSNCLFSIETHITCDFPGGGGVRTPCPPLWIHTCCMCANSSDPSVQE